MIAWLIRWSFDPELVDIKWIRSSRVKRPLGSFGRLRWHSYYDRGIILFILWWRFWKSLFALFLIDWSIWTPNSSFRWKKSWPEKIKFDVVRRSRGSGNTVSGTLFLRQWLTAMSIGIPLPQNVSSFRASLVRPRISTHCEISMDWNDVSKKADGPIYLNCRSRKRNRKQPRLAGMSVWLQCVSVWNNWEFGNWNPSTSIWL
jgi:hypothetical protein